ncbi:hypothetical protein TWF102_006968 [Orbilia oligospora]|uniref:Uncharacterized protein n=2 Tax=Orbilia oligospora TaxID=2813651 RepID=A0A7C8JCN5_ORBOL|nr:hypothetical protein TWF102_006968 [Orbilia oligospora]
MSLVTGFPSNFGVNTPPHVPKPKPGRRNNLTTSHIISAFSDEYWQRERGSRNGIGRMQNILTVIQEICQIILSEYKDQFSTKFPTYLKQTSALKHEMYAKFLVLLQTHDVESEGDRSLIEEMMAATDPLDPIERSEGRQWLFEHCMRRATDNHGAREKNKNPAKKRHRGVAHWVDGGDSSGSKHSQ